MNPKKQPENNRYKEEEPVSNFLMKGREKRGRNKGHSA